MPHVGSAQRSNGSRVRGPSWSRARVVVLLRHCRTAAVLVAGLSLLVGLIVPVSSIAVGRALTGTSEAGAATWGANANGQLGNGTTTNRAVPKFASGLGKGADVIAVAAGQGHSLALKADRATAQESPSARVGRVRLRIVRKSDEREAAEMLRHLLDAVERGELTADTPGRSTQRAAAGGDAGGAGRHGRPGKSYSTTMTRQPYEQAARPPIPRKSHPCVRRPDTHTGS
jgi:hypothetical protein